MKPCLKTEITKEKQIKQKKVKGKEYEGNVKHKQNRAAATYTRKLTNKACNKTVGGRDHNSTELKKITLNLASELRKPQNSEKE